MSPPSVSRLFGRRSRHQRRSSGAWFPSAVVQGSAASQQQPSAAGAAGGAASALPPQPLSFVSARQPFAGEVGGAAGTSTSGGTTARGSDGGGQQQAQTAVLQQALLSLKVIVAAGTVCAFHVGGGLESAADDAAGLPVSTACPQDLEAGMFCCACALGSSLACACPDNRALPFSCCSGGNSSLVTRHSQKRTGQPRRPALPSRSCAWRSTMQSPVRPAGCLLRLPAPCMLALQKCHLFPSRAASCHMHACFGQWCQPPSPHTASLHRC